MSTAMPFRLHIQDSVIDDLRERLARTRFPDQAPGEPWAYGTDVSYLKQLVEHCAGCCRFLCGHVVPAPLTAYSPAVVRGH